MDRKALMQAQFAMHSKDRWVLPYADFVTLLLAFFIVMYAVSSVNLSKYKQVTMSLGKALSFNAIQPVPRESLASLSVLSREGPVFANKEEEIHFLQAKLIKTPFFQIPFKDIHFQLRSNTNWAEISIEQSALFSQNNRLKINNNALLFLRKLSKHIPRNMYVTIEGYSTISPKHTNAWLHSSQIASTVANALTKYGVNRQQLKVVAMGNNYSFSVKNQAKPVSRIIILLTKTQTLTRLANPMQSLFEQDKVSQGAIYKKQKPWQTLDVKEIGTKKGLLFKQGLKDPLKKR